MSHPTTRVLAMLELLQARRQLSASELAAGLGVDQRTVRRYALRLAELGIPVTAERGRYGGYRLLPGYRLPPLMLTDDEAAAVVIGLMAAERLGQPVAGITTALAKIQRVLPAALSERVGALRQTLGFTQHPRKPAVAADTGVVLTLATAASQHQRVRLRYRSHADQDSRPRATRGEVERRTIRPGSAMAFMERIVRAGGTTARGPQAPRERWRPWRSGSRPGPRCRRCGSSRRRCSR